MAKNRIARFGVSLSRSLLKDLDLIVREKREKGYRNRSLAISDIVRDHPWFAIISNLTDQKTSERRIDHMSVDLDVVRVFTLRSHSREPLKRFCESC
jgi:metal-responsive CopG/Arc/MetJ family transcriptional regulator